MKRATLIFIAAVLLSNLSFAQDIITMKTGDKISAKIIEVGLTDVKYKKFENQSGPVYVASRAEISIIVYENGTKDVFNGETLKSDEPTVNNLQNKVSSKVPASSSGEITQSRILMGFSGVYPTGIWPATALTNMGTTSFLKGQGSTVKSYGFGVMIQGRVSEHFSLLFDINTYDYNILLAKKGSDVQSTWTVEESATHWDEPGAPQVQYVHNLPTDVHFDMASTGFRFGGKFSFGNNNIRPWAGAAFGLYKWTANYFNEDKSKSYGKDEGYVTGLTFLMGIDFGPMAGIVITPFVDLASPVATYKMTGLFYPQWDIDYESHIMGTSRFGISVAFSPLPAAKK